MKKIHYIILVFFLIIISIFILNTNIYSCPFKEIFHIPCPGCGLTRAFKSIIQLNIIESLKYIWCIPILIFLITYIMFITIYIIFDKYIYLEKLYKILNKNLIYIFFLIIISYIIKIFIVCI